MTAAAQAKRGPVIVPRINLDCAAPALPSPTGLIAPGFGKFCPATGGSRPEGECGGGKGVRGISEGGKCGS